MKILFLTENFWPETNASANRVYERAVFWAKWGHDVSIITTVPNFPVGTIHEGYVNGWYQTEIINQIKVIRVKTYVSANVGVWRRTLDFLSFMVTGFCAGMFQTRPDVVVATSPQFFSAVAGWLVSIFKRRPFVLELGDLWPASIVAVDAMKPSILIRMLEKLELFIYHRSSAIVALTPRFKENLVRRGIDGDKISIVINGVNLELFQKTLRDDALAASWGLQDRFVIGYVGTHGMAHGLSSVLDAASELKGDENICFLFVGDGAERERLMKRAEVEGIQNTRFVEPHPREMVPKIWSICDLALVHLRDSPVFAEVIPSKIFEAMAMGVPILLVTPQGIASDIVLSTRTGVWIPSEKPDRLATIVTKLRHKKHLLGQLSRNGIKNSVQFGRRRQAEEMLQTLEIAAAGWRNAGVSSDYRKTW